MTQTTTVTTATVAPLESALQAFESAKAALVKAREEAKAAEARKVEGRKAVLALMKEVGVTAEMLMA
jgi:hypothetical protein